jgi:hypothetical protein
MGRNRLSPYAIGIYANQYAVVTKNGHKGYDPHLPSVYTSVDFDDCRQTKVWRPVSFIAPTRIRLR